MEQCIQFIRRYLTNEGYSEKVINSWLERYLSIKEYISFCDVKKLGTADFFNYVCIGEFLNSKFPNDNTKAIMMNTLIYKDNECLIFKPTTFEESNIIGDPICCFAESESYWYQHYETDQESIYYVYDVMRTYPENFVAVTVRPSGRARVIDSAHNWKTEKDSLMFINCLGEGKNLIVTKDGKSIKTENYKTNMKQRIRLTEGQLNRVINESVKRILRENYGQCDIDEQTIRDEALSVIVQMEKEGVPVRWKQVAKRMGFHMSTFSSEELDILKSGIEMAMLDDTYEHWEDDADFEIDFNKLRGR